MTEYVEKVFESAKIEYYAALDFSNLYITRADMIEALGFTPRSVIIYIVPYYAGECENLSLYAGSLDYHIFLKQLGEELVDAIKLTYPESNARAFGDRSPIDERHGALIGGLGILGKNGLLINESYGSYVFIGEVITDLAPEVLGVKDPVDIKHCNNCGACISACPTGALLGSGECLSAITQRKGELTESEAELLVKFNTVWGCDVCQAVCPHNSAAKKTPVDFFYKERITSLTSEILSSMSKQEFAKRAFAWRGRKTVERNLEIYEKNSK